MYAQPIIAPDSRFEPTCSLKGSSRFISGEATTDWLQSLQLEDSSENQSQDTMISSGPKNVLSAAVATASATQPQRSPSPPARERRQWKRPQDDALPQLRQLLNRASAVVFEDFESPLQAVTKIEQDNENPSASTNVRTSLVVESPRNHPLPEPEPHPTLQAFGAVDYDNEEGQQQQRRQRQRKQWRLPSAQHPHIAVPSDTHTYICDDDSIAIANGNDDVVTMDEPTLADVSEQQQASIAAMNIYDRRIGEIAPEHTVINVRSIDNAYSHIAETTTTTAAVVEENEDVNSTSNDHNTSTAVQQISYRERHRRQWERMRAEQHRNGV